MGTPSQPGDRARSTARVGVGDDRHPGSRAPTMKPRDAPAYVPESCSAASAGSRARPRLDRPHDPREHRAGEEILGRDRAVALEGPQARAANTRSATPRGHDRRRASPRARGRANSRRRTAKSITDHHLIATRAERTRGQHISIPSRRALAYGPPPSPRGLHAQEREKFSPLSIVACAPLFACGSSGPTIPEHAHNPRGPTRRKGGWPPVRVTCTARARRMRPRDVRLG